MEKLTAFAEYLNTLEVDINELTFNEAVNLHNEVETFIKNKFKR